MYSLSLRLAITVSCLAQLASAFPQSANQLPTLQDQLFRRSFQKIPRSGADFVPSSNEQQFSKRQSTDPFLSLPPLVIPGLPLPIYVNYPGGVTVGRKAIPDSAHPFQAPASNAQRGGCPGLNALANYGYINRSGITNVGELLAALQGAMGFAPDLAGALVALGFRGMIDPTTLKMSIGRSDSRTNGLLSLVFGAVPGLFSPQSASKYEHDGSITFDDGYFNAGGFTDQFNGTLWKQRKASATNDFGGLFDVNWVAKTRYDSYNYCIANNPNCRWVAVSELLFYGAENLLWLMFPSSLPDGTTGPATAEPIEIFSGIKAQGNTYIKVPEKFPPSPDGKWYRRGTPLTLAEGVSTIVDTYAQYPVAFGANTGTTNSFVVQGLQLQPEDLTVNNIGCLILSEIAENVPASFNNLLNIQTTLSGLVNALLAPAFANFDCSA